MYPTHDSLAQQRNTTLEQPVSIQSDSPTSSSVDLSDSRASTPASFTFPSDLHGLRNNHFYPSVSARSHDSSYERQDSWSTSPRAPSQASSRRDQHRHSRTHSSSFDPYTGNGPSSSYWEAQCAQLKAENMVLNGEVSTWRYVLVRDLNILLC